MRRGVRRYGQHILKCQHGFFSKLVPTVVENMKDAFPELVEKMHFVQEVILVAKEKATKTFSAKTWISEVAAVCGGKGGGSPVQAQGQSKDTSNVEAAFKKAEEIFQSSL